MEAGAKTKACIIDIGCDGRRRLKMWAPTVEDAEKSDALAHRCISAGELICTRTRKRVRQAHESASRVKEVAL